MTRAISRDSFHELKQYLGVHLQQGRVILDSDWNEGQDIMAALARRLGQDGFRDGVLREGFEIQPAIGGPSNPNYASSYFQGGRPLLQQFPGGPAFDRLDSMDGWALSGAGRLRTSRDRTFDGTSFLRLTEHTGTVQITRTLTSAVDLSTMQFASFRFRLNQSFAPPPTPLPGTASFFLEDTSGNRNVYKLTGLWGAKDLWTPYGALPLDLRFSIVDLDLVPCYVGQAYTSGMVCIGATGAGPTWTLLSGSLPSGVTVVADVNNGQYATLSGTPGAGTAGTYNFTVKATQGGLTATRAFTLRVQAPPQFPQPFNSTTLYNNLKSFWEIVKARTSKPNNGGTAANLAAIKKYGFEVFQANPALIWDFGALYVGNRSQANTQANNNFVISGPRQAQLAAIAQEGMFEAADTNPAAITIGLGLLQNATDPTRARSPRAYVNGLPCVQPADVLYRDQADPNDPPLAPPTDGNVRKDLVYLDVWCEPVTYVEDPELREIALGGPDTATRKRIRQRVRVAQGGAVPTDSGVGRGTLATEGSYTDTVNRLYLVEVDTGGDIGTAKLRWSEDNGSTIQRVIETIAPGATRVKVEDATAFRPGDFLLIRKEFAEERHQISSVSGNAITLQEPVGTSGFALAERPKVQRWNAFQVAVTADTNDPLISSAIPLSSGVNVRIGGRALRKGDFWTFRARYLAGDDASGINPVTRIEALDYQPPQGVLHQYLPLGMIVRDPAAQEPGRITVFRDLRKRAGQVVLHQEIALSASAIGTTQVPLGAGPLGLTSSESMFLCVFTLGTFVSGSPVQLQLELKFFSNAAVDPNTSSTGQAGTVLTFVTVPIGSQNLTVFAVLGGTAFANEFPDEIVLARVAALTSNLGPTVDLVGSLQIIELKNQIPSLNL